MSKPLRVVATYTTLPDRYEVLRRSMESMRAQTHKLDAIYLALPKTASRLGKEYPPLPDEFRELCTVVPTEIDYGPITKIYGALISETDPSTVIISCDDDVLFAPDHVEKMIGNHLRYPNISICGTGALISRGLALISIVSTVHPFRPWNGMTGFKVDPVEGRKVDLIFGVAGVLYRRGFFPSNERLHDEILQYSLRDHSVFCNDDVLVSGYLSRQGIERRVFLDIPTITHVNGADALSSNIISMITRLNRSISKVKEYGFYPTMEQMDVTETTAFRVGVALVIIIIIIILCIIMFQTM